jgi:DNA helicase-2/ATP-dependent DNA helicase PcrA
MTIQKFDPASDGFEGGPREMVLVGPPGTGKTRSVLKSFLVPAMGALRPAEILATTFTKAGAREMLSRLAEETGQSEYDLRTVCSTIHSEGFRIMRETGWTLWKETMRKPGRPPEDVKAATIDEDEEEVPDGWDRLARACPDERKEAYRLWELGRCLTVPDGPPEARTDVLRAFRAALERTYTKHDIGAMVEQILRYEALKKELQAVDFSDMQLRALWAGTVKHRGLIVVDEAQDLSPLQVRLVRLWASSADRVVWVGDPDQSIFKFAGADGKYLLHMIREGVPARGLTQSYRVPKMPHAYARRVILQNIDREDCLYSPSDEAGEVLELRSPTQALGILEDRPTSAFVLARTGVRASEYATALSRAGIPFWASAGACPWKNGGLRLALLAIWDILEGHLIGRDALLALLSKIPARPGRKSDWLEGTKKSAEGAVRALEEGAFVRSETIGELGLNVDAIRRNADVHSALEDIGQHDACEFLLAIADRCGMDGLRKTPTIEIMTMHRSKGREADTVILDLEAPYPVEMACRRFDREAIEEERRVLYVAITRAKKFLVLVRGRRDMGELVGGF